MRRFFILLLCLLCATTTALATPLPPIYLDVGDGFMPYSVLPLADGRVVVSGMYVYRDLLQIESDLVGHEEMPHRTEAYIACLSAEGETEWSLRLGDPQGHNFFRADGPLPDGRLLVTFGNADGNWGMQHYLITTDGLVDAMLPTGELREMGVQHTLRACEAGYFAGGYYTEDGFGLDHTREGDALLLLDFDLQPIWTLQDPLLDHTLLSLFAEGPDGYFLYGDQFIVTPTSAYTESTLLVKISLDGEILWHQTWETADRGRWVDDALALPDGGLLLCGQEEHEGTVTRLDADGETVAEWNYADIAYVSSAAPLGDGYVLACSRTRETPEAPVERLLLHVDADGQEIGRRSMSLDSEWNSFLYVIPAPNDTVLAHGSVYSDAALAEESAPFNRAFYEYITAADFE